MVVADVFQSVAVLGVVEALVLDLPAALGQGVERATADLSGGKIGEPVGLDDFPVRMTLAITDHAHALPAQRLPRIKVFGVPELDRMGAVPELEVRGWGRERRGAAWNNSGRLTLR